jgi:DNA-binding transcriptional LysR family regulator
VAPLVRRFRAKHPRLTIDLRLSDRYVDLAEEGFDLAIRIGNLGSSSLIARKLARTELWAVAAPGYLAERGTPEAPQDFAGHTCIRDTNLRDSGAWMFEVEGEMRRFPVAGGLLVNSARAVARLAADGEGIALCPDYVAAPLVSEGQLARVLAGYPSLTLDIHAVYLDSTHMPARVRTMLDFLAERFRSAATWTEFAT